MKITCSTCKAVFSDTRGILTTSELWAYARLCGWVVNKQSQAECGKCFGPVVELSENRFTRVAVISEACATGG